MDQDYWAGWRDGWHAASQAIFNARDGSRSGLEPSLPEAAGNKPAPRKRGRPPKSASMSPALAPAAPEKRKRGRPPKNRALGARVAAAARRRGKRAEPLSIGSR